MNNFHSIGGIKMNKNIDFVNGNTKKCLLEMTVPMIIAMFLNMAYNLVDSLWIGNLLGEQAYAALTNSTPIILILTSIGMGATNGHSLMRKSLKHPLRDTVSWMNWDDVDRR